MSFFTGFQAQAADYKFNMSYIFFGNTSGYKEMVDNTQNSLNEVAPHYFALDKSGNLIVKSTIDTEFISDMHRRGIAVVPFLTNEWSRTIGRAALENREHLARSLADAVRLYDLDGVNVDIENLTATDRDSHTDFIKLIRAFLPAEKSVVVSVAANPNGWTTGWQGSYDYKALAESSNYLMMMTYDEHYYGSTPGPVSSLSFVEKSIQHALLDIPKEKLVLGLPFYGRIWSNSGSFPTGYGVTNSKITQLIRNYGGSVYVEPHSQSTRAVITIRPGDAKPVIGGQALGAGTYTIWYEGEDSIKTKLSLVSKYDIKGTGSWALGQESSSTWNYYKLWLNNCTFTDIENSPAKDYILDAYMNNLIDGCSCDQFSPDAPLTRAQAATLVVRWLGLKAELNPAYSFDDCLGNWAQAYIETARKYNIISGVGDNQFVPDRPMTREEAAVLINNVLNYKSNPIGTMYSDVTRGTNAWSCNAIEALSANGIIGSNDNGTFHPQGVITRAEAVVMFSQITPQSTNTSIIPITLMQ